MIVNPFVNQNQDDKIGNIKQDRDSIVAELQKYVINNYIDYLKDELKDALKNKLEEYICTKYYIKSEIEINQIIQVLFSKLFGYDILHKYITMPNVTDIRVVKYYLIYVKSLGKWKKVEEKFKSEEEFIDYIRYIILKNNASINFETPIVVVSDKKYNLRIEAWISPVNVISPSLVIRIHRLNSSVSLETLYLDDEMLDAKSYKIISKIVSKGKNVILAGRGGSGKTTLLREMIYKIPEEFAITISEETAELYIKDRNVIEREILENRDISKKINLEKLLRHCLVMSNDVLVVGELKGAETAVFLDAISTGHIGMGTVHSDSSKNTIDRLITLIKRDVRYSDYKEDFIKVLLANSIDYLVYMENYKVEEIASVSYDSDKEKITINLEYKRGKRDEE